MAKRLHMTAADYVAIAISPALIMALVGSLVFFLIEVMYTGEFVARLNYIFALFVFATVLIARISIEMGAEKASLFALALGVVMFLALMRFVEFPSAFSHLINLALMAVVWLSAHKLTWDCTLIDDDEDSSGEGLMQRIGVDGPGDGEPTTSTNGENRNELLDETVNEASVAQPWWQRFLSTRKKRHTPGLWVLYFSLAALPLFGIGQGWIPVSDTGRRRYAFILLFIYVLAALSLLVTTSFLGLRRYLRQRRIEMPIPVAGTWVATGAVLIAIVMFLALLVPRPAAEVAISRVPWQIGSPGGNSSSKYSIGNDGQQQQEDGTPTNTQQDNYNTDAQAPGPNKGASGQSESGEQKSGDSGHSTSAGESGKAGKEPGNKADQPSSQSSAGQSDGKSPKDQTSREEKSGGGQRSQSSNSPSNNQTQQINNSQKNEQPAGQPKDGQPQQSASKPAAQPIQHPSTPKSPPIPQAVFNALGGLTGIVKVVLYAVIGLVIGYLLWKHGRELAKAFMDILRELRAFFAQLFGGRTKAAVESEATEQAASARPVRFADFHDPFASGDARRLPPDELVRYTFSAFEAWASDHGCPRTPDRTPSELLRTAVATESPMYDEARRMVRLYSEVAYAARTVPREAANTLQGLWRSMADR
jgi:hypothetical protein